MVWLGDLWAMLSPVFGTLLVLAQIYELWFLISNVLPSKQRDRRSAFTKFACYPFHQLQTEFSIKSKSTRKVFRDFASGRYYIPWGRKPPVIIRSADHMQQLSESPELSQRAVYADIFGFKYTINHDERSFDPNEQTMHRYRLFSRAIKITGLAQIAALQPYLQAKCAGTLRNEIDSQRSQAGWTPIKIAPLMRDLASGMLSVYLFGEELSEEPEFSAALVCFYHDVITFVGALQVVPSFMASTVHSLITKRGRALRIIFRRLNQAMDPTQNQWNEKPHLKSMTMFHNMVESSKESEYWTPNALIQAVVGIWFAASHQPWINLHFVLLELCSRPEYVQMIRQEIESQDTLDYATISTLPILDSFIKEAVRLNPLDLMSIRRKALKPFQFANNGPKMEVGQIACVPGYEIMHNPAKFPDPDEFDGLRFVRDINSISGGKSKAGDGEMRGTTLTEGTKDFPIWGYGSKICPGRWHAVLVIKIAIVQLVKDYDLKLEDENARRFFFWETFQTPYESTKVLFRKRG